MNRPSKAQEICWGYHNATKTMAYVIKHGLKVHNLDNPTEFARCHRILRTIWEESLDNTTLFFCCSQLSPIRMFYVFCHGRYTQKLEIFDLKISDIVWREDWDALYELIRSYNAENNRAQ